jgi:hypothetical protein
MKRNLLLVLIICVILALGACGARPVVETAAGKFETSQATMDKITDGYGNELNASEGNKLLVIYLTPADDNIVTEDDAYNYFYSGTKAQVDGQVYDMKCISLEKVGEKVRYGLVFEIVNNGYNDQNKPVVQLSPPQSLPQLTPKPTATPLPAPTVSSVPTPTLTVDPEESPEESPEET